MRRVCQLRARRPDLAYVTLRGNVDTRLRKLEEGQYDAIVLAAAGLRRLGLLDRPHQVLPVDLCLPAVGQGTLAIEGRLDDTRVRELVAHLEHRPTRVVTEAERTLLRKLQGSCKVPLAGHARFDTEQRRLRLDGLVGSLDGERILTSVADRWLTGREGEGDLEAAHALGEEVAEGLIARGARDLMREAEVQLVWQTQQN